MTNVTFHFQRDAGDELSRHQRVALREARMTTTAIILDIEGTLVDCVPQTLRYFEQMQERIVSFVTEHSKITARRFTQLMHNTGELVMDMGTVLDGRQAVEEGLIDELGGLRDALGYLYKEIEK